MEICPLRLHPLLSTWRSQSWLGCRSWDPDEDWWNCILPLMSTGKIHFPQHSPACRRSLCHQGSCHGIQWRTSLARGPGWEHSLQPSNVAFKCVLSVIFGLHSQVTSNLLHHILTNLSDINFCSELPCSCTVGCENCCSISCIFINYLCLRAREGSFKWLKP